jgi:serine/threonine-protein kinase HipA
MYLHPDGIARRTRWLDADGRADNGNPDWAWVAKVAADALGIDERVIWDALKVTAEQVATLPREMKALGVDKDVMSFLQPVTEQNLVTLDQLK